MACVLNDTNQYFSSDETLIATPFTLCATVKTSTPSGRCSLSINNGGSAHRSLIQYATNTLRVTFTEVGSAVPQAITTGSLTNNVYGVIIGGTISANSRFASFQGERVNNEQSISSQDALRFIGVGNFYGSSGWSSEPWSGTLAECGIWSAALTDDENASLTKGFKPFRIRPQSLFFYAPLIRATIDFRKGLTLTPVNSPTVAAHPRVY